MRAGVKEAAHHAFGNVKHEVEYTGRISRCSVVRPGMELVVVDDEALGVTTGIVGLATAGVGSGRITR